MTILLVITFFTMTISGICSLFEAILYSTRVGVLEVARKTESKNKLATKILYMKRNIAAPIAAILILNTIANTAGASIAGMYAAKVLGENYVLPFSIALTLGILFFSEIVPKTIGAVHWRSLWSIIVVPLSLMKSMLHPLIYINQKLSNFITRGQSYETITEEEILAAAQMGAREGEISDQEHLIIHNLIHLENRKVKEIMTPRSVIFSLNAQSIISQSRDIAADAGFTRIPIYEGERENIIGYVTIHDLSSAKNLESPDICLRTIARAIFFVPETANCFIVLFDFLRTRKQIAIIIDEYGGVAGLITLEDLLETLLGHEIVDEHDHAVDLQEVARRQREKFKLDEKPTNYKNEG